MILSFNVNNFTKGIEEDLNIVVFLERGIKQKDIDKVTQDVRDINTTTNKLSNKFDKIQKC